MRTRAMAGAKIMLFSRKAADLEEVAAQLQAVGIDTQGSRCERTDRLAGATRHFVSPRAA
jgi:hypothetical protein